MDNVNMPFSVDSWVFETIGRQALEIALLRSQLAAAVSLSDPEPERASIQAVTVDTELQPKAAATSLNTRSR